MYSKHNSKDDTTTICRINTRVCKKFDTKISTRMNFNAGTRYFLSSTFEASYLWKLQSYLALLNDRKRTKCHLYTEKYRAQVNVTCFKRFISLDFHRSITSSSSLKFI